MALHTRLSESVAFGASAWSTYHAEQGVAWPPYSHSSEPAQHGSAVTCVVFLIVLLFRLRRRKSSAVVEHADLEVTVADAKLGVGEPSRHICVHLGVNVRVNPDQDARRFVDCPRRSCDILQVKLGVHINQRALLNRQSQLLRQLAIAIEDCPTIHNKRVSDNLGKDCGHL